MGSVSGRGEIKWRQPLHHGASKDLTLVHTIQLKPMIKANSSGRMVSSGVSDVVIASVYSEKTRLKKLMITTIMFIIIMNKLQETAVFSGRQKLTSTMKLKPEKWWYTSNWCSTQVSLHREPPEVGLVEKLSGTLYWWVELGVPSLYRECYHSLC